LKQINLAAPRFMIWKIKFRHPRGNTLGSKTGFMKVASWKMILFHFNVQFICVWCSGLCEVGDAP
jgi:hypothetical protein